MLTALWKVPPICKQLNNYKLQFLPKTSFEE